MKVSLKKIRDRLENIKAIYTIVAFFIAIASAGAKEYVDQAEQLEGANQAVAVYARLASEAWVKETKTVERTVIKSDCSICKVALDKAEKALKETCDHMYLHGSHC